MSIALITGIEGFTGRYLAKELDQHGYCVAGIGLRHRPIDIPLECYEQVDLLDSDATCLAIKRIQPDIVFHLAGISHVQSSPDLIYRINVAASRNLLAALAGMAHPPAFTLMVSSANIYGNTEGMQNEDTLPAPCNDYAVSKLAMEYMAKIWQPHLHIAVVRPFNYTGRGQGNTFVIPKLIHHFRERLSVIELGNTQVIREFGDVRDVVSIYTRLAKSRAPWGPFNICTGTGYSLHEVIKMLRELTGYSPEIRISNKFVRPNEVHTLIGSSKFLEKYIGSITRIPLEETLRWMLED
ncbi:NAD-dependent epimerase/dehydratase family protein [Bacteroides nordii]